MSGMFGVLGLAFITIPGISLLSQAPQHFAGFMVPEARAVLDILAQLKK